MESASVAGLFNSGYRVDDGKLLGIPLRTASTRALAGSWWEQREMGKSFSSLTQNDGVLRGKLTSPLDVDLYDCSLIYDTWVHLFDSSEFAAGTTVEVGDLLRRDLDWRLTRQRIAKGVATVYETSPWMSRIEMCQGSWTC